MKCFYHENDRDISHYVFWNTDIRKKNHIDIYECRECKEKLERDIDRENRIIEHNRKQKEDARLRREIKNSEEYLKRLKSIENDLWDFKVRDWLAKGIKLKGYEKGLYKERIPKEILQLARATMKLMRKIEHIKKSLPTRKEIEEQKRLKQAEIDMINKKPIMRCTHHGDRFLENVIKSGVDKTNGKQRFKCKECMKRIHAENYKKNKTKILAAHNRYKEQDPEKYREMKNASKRKCWALNKEKYIKKSLDYDKKNPNKKRLRQRRFKNKAVKELADVYVKNQIVRDTRLKWADIPQEMVDIKKGIMTIKRLVKYEKINKGE
jgi:hypothetical protein